MQFMYQQGILGGTFDHFHLGHQKLLATAFERSEHVTIGITKPIMYQHKFLAATIEPYEIREAQLKKYLAENGLLQRATLLPLEDIFGITLQEKNIDAIFGTEENSKNIELINHKRIERNFPALEIIIVEYVMDEHGEKITSERIRKGEIDTRGVVYAKVFDNKQKLTLPGSLRAELQKPLGEVVETTQKVIEQIGQKLVIAVGDIIVAELKKANLTPAVSIIDFKSRREALEEQAFTGKKIENQAGSIEYAAVAAYLQALNDYLNTHENQTLVIAGEEDLLALPAILLAPFGSIVLYGQFDQGVVINTITQELKLRVKYLLEQFK